MTIQDIMNQLRDMKANFINGNINSEEFRDGIIYQLNFSAKSFLHHQVRSIVGCLEKVGCGKWGPKKMQEILLSKERSQCAALAPSSGLYLTKIEY